MKCQFLVYHPIRILTYCFSCFWRFFSCSCFSGAQILFTDGGHRGTRNLCLRRVIRSRLLRVSISGRTSTSGIAAQLQPPRTCDLRTM